MRRTYKYSAVTRDEDNAADGHYQTASVEGFLVITYEQDYKKNGGLKCTREDIPEKSCGSI
jgi:hypothetical protein